MNSDRLGYRFWEELTLKRFHCLAMHISAAYPLTELHQTRFLGLLQAIPMKSRVENGKIPVLADYPNFAPWCDFWRFFGRLQDDTVLRLPIDRIAPNSVSWAFAGHSTGIKR